MKPITAARALAALIVATPIFASAADAPPLTGNMSFISEYKYRGISQTNARPALQGGFDYALPGGVYLGTWASNVSWLSDGGAGAVSNSLEWDFYGGYKGQAGPIGYDAGLLYYYYPGAYPSGFTSPNTLEAYVAGSWQMLTLKYSHSLTNLFGFTDSKGSGYLDLSASVEIAKGIKLDAHVGNQSIPSTTGRSKSDCSYTDWKLGVSTEVSGFTVGLAYIDTNAKGGTGQCYRNAFNKDLGKGNLLLSVGKSF